MRVQMTPVGFTIGIRGTIKTYVPPVGINQVVFTVKFDEAISPVGLTAQQTVEFTQSADGTIVDSVWGLTWTVSN